MITKFNNFKINEGIYADIKNEYGSLGEYVEHVYDNIKNEEKEDFSRILGEYLKLPVGKNDSKKFDENDIVLTEYWYNNMLTPVKIVEKKGRSYIVSHNINESDIQNAPNETLKKEDIIDHYRKRFNDKSVNTSIRISKAVNILNPYDQMALVKSINDNFKIEESNKFEDLNIKNLIVLNKTGFNSFLKILTALSLPELTKEEDRCPNSFFSFYITESVNKERLLSILERFKSMEQISDYITQSQGSIKLYFGITYTTSLFLEYGINIDDSDQKIKVGEYKLSKRNFKELKDSKGKVLQQLRDDIDSLSKEDVISHMKIKKLMSDFSPGYFEKKTNPYIKDKSIIQRYYGMGEWKDGIIEKESLDKVRNEFISYCKKKKIDKKVLFNIDASKFWITIKIKIKR